MVGGRWTACVVLERYVAASAPALNEPQLRRDPATTMKCADFPKSWSTLLCRPLQLRCQHQDSLFYSGPGIVQFTAHTTAALVPR